MYEEFTLKKSILFVACLSIIPCLVWAEMRSTRDKIFDSDYMSESTNIKRFIVNQDVPIPLKSPYKGELLRTSDEDLNRSIVLIDTREKIEDLPDGLRDQVLRAVAKKGLDYYYVFANFVHSAVLNPEKAEFYVALLPRNSKVQNVSLQVEWFGMGVGAHAQVRLKMDKQLIIIPQSYEDVPPILPYQSGDLIYSLQAIRVDGQANDWNPLKGIMGEFANALQFFSTPAKARMKITKSVIDSYEIRGLTQKERNNILTSALKISDKQQEEEIYNTVFNSCITHALIALQSSISTIDINHFNPYSLVNSVEASFAEFNKFRSNGDKLSLKREESLNKEFSQLADGELMTMERIKSTPLYSQTAPFLPIVMRPEFDDIVRQLTYFIVERQITYPQVAAVWAEIKSGKKLSEVSENKEFQELVAKITPAWQEAFPGQEIDVLFQALEAMKTQDL